MFRLIFSRFGGLTAPRPRFECLRQAQQQKRRCYLFAFSAGEDLKEMELDLTSNLQGALSGPFHFGRATKRA